MASVLRPGSGDSLPIPSLSDGRVILRPWGDEDLPTVIAAASDALVQRFRYSVPSFEADARRWLEVLEPDRVAGRRLELAIATDVGAVGSISLTGTEQATAELRYWLLASARGHGLASAAVRLLTSWAMRDLGIARLVLNVEPENEPSRRLADRCGFVLEEQLRSCWDGSRGDLLVYVLTSRTPRAS
jgi:RimJ/RimL family protein N-acetyltransferase